jgi:hypothetical protein
LTGESRLVPAKAGNYIKEIDSHFHEKPWILWSSQRMTFSEQKLKGRSDMKILHILKSKPTELTKKIIEYQSRKHEVKVIDLTGDNISYENIIDEIFSRDKVISW